MANVRTRGTDKVKVVSAVITLAVIVALVFGIFSVAQNVKKSKNNNLVNLNETEGNVAIKTDDDPAIREKALNETVKRIKKNSLELKSRSVREISDLQKIIQEKAKLQKLYISL